MHNEDRHLARLADIGCGASQEELLELGFALAGHDHHHALQLHCLEGDDVSDAVCILASLHMYVPRPLL